MIHTYTHRYCVYTYHHCDSFFINPAKSSLSAADLYMFRANCLYLGHIDWFTYVFIFTGILFVYCFRLLYVFFFSNHRLAISSDHRPRAGLRFEPTNSKDGYTRIVFCVRYFAVSVTVLINLPPAQFGSGHAHTLDVVARAWAQQLSTIVERVQSTLASHDDVRAWAHAMKRTPSAAAAAGRDATPVIRALMRYSSTTRGVSLSRGRRHFANPRGWRWRVAPRCGMTVLGTVVRWCALALSLVLVNGGRRWSLIIVVGRRCRRAAVWRIPLWAATATSTLIRITS